MSAPETTPMLSLGARRSDGVFPILICAGQAIATPSSDGARALEIDPALELGRGPAPGGIVPRFETDDPHMSRSHALLRRTEGGAIVLRDLDSRNGILVDGELVRGETQLADGAVLFLGAHVFVFRLMSRADLNALSLERARPFGPVPTLSPTMARLGERLRRLARSPVDLLLGGETGVGKEVFAHAVHKESGRRGPLVAINCAALPDTLLESELFGYARGAHSMAEQGKAGLLEQAEGGTLFLDEIGEMSSGAQSKLLRFLQDRLVLPLGATRSHRLDVRVIAATRRPISDDDDTSGIRFDLASRLGPEPFIIPPLRSRPEDIGSLARHFLRDHPRPFDISAYRALFLHRWPGNVRELEKTLQLASVLSEGWPEIDAEHLAFVPSAARTMAAPSAQPAPWMGDATMPIDVAAQPSRPTPDLLATLLQRHRGNVADVARELRRQRTLVWRWVRKAGLDPTQFRDSGN
jgi:transcriptional regulator with PAS, ATPase and Fis domain